MRKLASCENQVFAEVAPEIGNKQQSTSSLASTKALFARYAKADEARQLLVATRICQISAAIFIILLYFVQRPPRGYCQTTHCGAQMKSARVAESPLTLCHLFLCADTDA